MTDGLKSLSSLVNSKQAIGIFKARRAGYPLVVSYGVGVDSTAMLIGLRSIGWRPDVILTSIPGNEKADTVRYLPIINEWCIEVGFPEIQFTRYVQQKFTFNTSHTIVGQCLANRTMPSVSFGRKSCSLKWKGDILDAFVTALYGLRTCYRAIGYDCSKRDSRRFAIAKDKKARKRPMDIFGYPLQAWGWDRERCKSEILRAGLPLPVKSSCIICGAMKQPELATLNREELITCVIVEANAAINNLVVAGLGRKWRFSDVIVRDGLLESELVDHIWQEWDKPSNPITQQRDRSAEDILNDWLYFYLDIWDGLSF